MLYDKQKTELIQYPIGVIICSDKSGCLAEEYARENGIEFRVCGGHVLRLDKTALTMRYRATAELKPTMQAEWTSSDKSVAKVDQSGKVTAVGRGTAIITAVSEDGQTARCIVTVQYTWRQWLIRILLGGWIWY